ncbi:MAG TPA: error-prone DNA polymerase [Candidatus Dormibacteraeota bacterium]|nr:error-prone DNA polymerase [Candidatus Dormibacteraeota bacterium]
MKYIELHSCSAFSFLGGASCPEGLAARAAELELPAAALLDRDGVYGSPRFHTASKRAGICAHVGAEISVEGFGKKVGLPPWMPPTAALEQPVRLAVLVKNRTGYQNLCRLMTRYKLREKEKGTGTATLEEIAGHAEGLVCLTGGEEGVLAASLFRDGEEEARKNLETLTTLFGQKNVYVELQRHFNPKEEHRNQAAVRLAETLHLPLLATNGVRYAVPRDREILDVFTCLRHHCKLETAGRLLERNDERHLRSAKEMTELFSDLPEAIASTEELSSRLEFTLADLGYQFPNYPVPAGENMNSFLRKRTDEGFRNRYAAKDDEKLYQRAEKQIQRELALIEKLNLAGYFLIVWDIVRFCREQNILVQGRGSAANSAVCYSLGITAVDPVGMELLFERFLSEQRGEWPDIDLDLPSGDQREKAIQYVYQRYGQLGAAMTANVITYRGRSAAREVGKVLGFDQEALDQLSAQVNGGEWRGPADTFENHFQQAGFDLQHHRVRKYWELCERLQDLPRHLGQHSGGMVVCQGQLDSVVPLEPATMPGRVVVQWDKEDCADMGIVKVDLLGLGMMAVLEECLELIPKHYEKKVDLAQLPADDPVVYKTLRQADTVGMFQVESRAQMSSLPRNAPVKFYDLVVQVAIIRPGPIVGKMMHPYMRRRQGREQVTYAHPSLEPVLKRTLGVPLFQEQLLKLSMIAANFSGGEAEDLRRAMGFKRSEERMREIETKLRSGMAQNGISPEAQEEIITQITSFANFGFPESHAASFALIAYASAFLKVHYLAAFTAALLNNQPMGFYSPATIVKDAQLHRLKVKPIHVLHSDWLCTLEKSVNKEGKEVPCLRIGFRYVRGLREARAQEIVRERQKQSFNGIEDLIRRVPDLQKAEIVTLSEIGALNSLGKDLHRRSALWQVERAARQAGPLLDAIPEQLDFSPLHKMSDEERLIADFHGSGMTTGPHPMTYCRAELAKANVKSARDLGRIPDGQYTKTAGCVIARQRPGTAKGFVFLSLEDETGIANIIVKPDLYEKCRLTINRAKFLRVDGVLQNQDGVISIKASRVLPLSVTSANTDSHDYH